MVWLQQKKLKELICIQEKKERDRKIFIYFQITVFFVFFFLGNRFIYVPPYMRKICECSNSGKGHPDMRKPNLNESKKCPKTKHCMVPVNSDLRYELRCNQF